MADNKSTTARVVTHPAAGTLEATVELAASPERVFTALASREITDWWVRPGVFDTREWTADVRPGGRWKATGVSRGQPYAATGDILEVDAPRKLVHTWDGVGAAGAPSTLTYELEPLPNGTRLVLRQAGFSSEMACREFAAGWQTSFERLEQVLDVGASVA
ncbi:MAG TPA: SRPBCC domain-containing protein [Gemmatimonadaceae bacterium]|nr:SRPBCC domain-containing protein [Gemmatimonadaceae bacterium]